MRKLGLCSLAAGLLIFCGVARATVFGEIRGIVHDPQHRPIQGSTVTVKAKSSDWMRSATTDDSGVFLFNAVPVGEYVVTVTSSGFASADQNVIVESGTEPILHFALHVAGRKETVFRHRQVQGHFLVDLNRRAPPDGIQGLHRGETTDPRFGVTLKLPRLDWVLHGFYGYYYQAPPLVTATGALLGLANSQNFTFAPLHGERDREWQYGLTIPYQGWTLDAETYQTKATNWLDHNNIGESNLFWPITWEAALIQGWELTLRSPDVWHHASSILPTPIKSPRQPRRLREA
jgi:Carboxypeptidase regulatory-like domain